MREITVKEKFNLSTGWVKVDRSMTIAAINNMFKNCEMISITDLKYKRIGHDLSKELFKITYKKELKELIYTVPQTILSTLDKFMNSFKYDIEELNRIEFDYEIEDGNIYLNANVFLDRINNNFKDEELKIYKENEKNRVRVSNLCDVLNIVANRLYVRQ